MRETSLCGRVPGKRFAGVQWQPQVCGVQAQPRPEAEACWPEDGALNTESCFATALLRHFGQVTFSRIERTIVSKRCLQLRQQYSKIGMAFLLRQNL
jgi:hypothetical protein